jgi:carbamoyl-phosphate synthase large subunit
MPKINILVTGVGGDIGQSIIKCLKASGYNLNLTGCDVDNYAAGRKAVANFFVVPRAPEAGEYFRSIRAIVRKYKIRYIIPSTEPEIQFFDKNRTHFLNSAVKILINRSFILDTFFDKFKTVDFLKRNGFACPKTFLLKDFKNQLDYPLIIKAKHGYGSKELIKVKNSQELNFYKSILRQAVIQEEVGDESEEYTTGVFSDGETVHSITFKRRLGYGSLSKVAELVINRKISALAEELARLVALAGSINIQTRKTVNGFVVLEINPRFSSTVYFRHYFGFQDVLWWLDMLEGKDNIEFKLKYKKGVGVRNLGEVFIDLA